MAKIDLISLDKAVKGYYPDRPLRLTPEIRNMSAEEGVLRVLGFRGVFMADTNPNFDLSRLWRGGAAAPLDDTAPEVFNVPGPTEEEIKATKCTCGRSNPETRTVGDVLMLRCWWCSREAPHGKF